MGLGIRQGRGDRKEGPNNCAYLSACFAWRGQAPGKYGLKSESQGSRNLCPSQSYIWEKQETQPSSQDKGRWVSNVIWPPLVGEAGDCRTFTPS